MVYTVRSVTWSGEGYWTLQLAPTRGGGIDSIRVEGKDAPAKVGDVVRVVLIVLATDLKTA